MASERLLEERRIASLNFGPAKPASEGTNTPAMSEESEREPKTSAGCGGRMRNCDAKMRNAKLSFPKRKTVIKNREKSSNSEPQNRNVKSSREWSKTTLRVVDIFSFFFLAKIFVKNERKIIERK